MYTISGLNILKKYILKKTLKNKTIATSLVLLQWSYRSYCVWRKSLVGTNNIYEWYRRFKSD